MAEVPACRPASRWIQCSRRARIDGRPPAGSHPVEAIAVMAKDKPRKKPGPKPDPDRVRSAAIMVRGRPEWKAWVERLADHARAPSLNDLFDRALVVYARHVDFEEVAPKR